MTNVAVTSVGSDGTDGPTGTNVNDVAAALLNQQDLFLVPAKGDVKEGMILTYNIQDYVFFACCFSSIPSP